MTEVPRLGIVGLGDQGAPMARRYLEKGWPLGFVARRPEVIAEFSALGGTAEATLADLGRHSDVVLVIVVDDAQVWEVLVESGMLDHMRPGSTVVVHSTIHPDTCVELAELAGRRGIGLMDAPVSGGSKKAQMGQLTMLIGVDEPALLERLRPVLEVCGSAVERMGPVGSGQVAKLLNNFFYAAHRLTALQEEHLIDRLGVDPAAAARILPTCSGSTEAFRYDALRDPPFSQLQHEKGLKYAMQVLGKDVWLFMDLLRKRGIDASHELEHTVELVYASLGRTD